jgi:putative phosphoesterase
VIRLALISDIHGNGVALDAVVADLARRDVDELVCLGDVAAGGPQPRQVISRLRDLRCQVVRGNADGWLLDGLPPGRSVETRRLSETVAWARGRLTADELAFLGALPATLRVSADGVDLLCFHGSPRADLEPVLATTPEGQLDAWFGDAPTADLFAGGHTHLQLLRRHRQSLLVNPGSVGLPLGSLGGPGRPLPTWAEYAIVAVSGGDVEIAYRRLPIDVNALRAATAAMPHATWAADLERRIMRWNAKAAA